MVNMVDMVDAVSDFNMFSEFLSLGGRFKEVVMLDHMLIKCVRLRGTQLLRRPSLPFVTCFPIFSLQQSSCLSSPLANLIPGLLQTHSMHRSHLCAADHLWLQ